MTTYRTAPRHKGVALALTAADARALAYVHRHLVTIAEDFPQRGAGNGYDAITVRDMHRGVEIIGDLIRQYRGG